MDISVEVQGLKGVEDALAQAGPKLAKRALRKALKAGGDLMVASAKSRAPLLKVATKRRQPGEGPRAAALDIHLCFGGPAISEASMTA